MKFVIEGVETIRDVFESTDQEEALMQFKAKYPACHKIVSIKPLDNFNKGGGNKMKIKLSKSQWEMVGKKAGWMKKANTDTSWESMGLNQYGDESAYSFFVSEIKKYPNIVELLKTTLNKDIQEKTNNPVGELRSLLDSITNIKQWIVKYLSEPEVNRLDQLMAKFYVFVEKVHEHEN